MKIPKKKILIVLIVCFVCTGCSKSNTQKSREAWLQKGNNEIIIGMSYPVSETESKTGFLNGVNMALEKVNKDGVLGKKITIVKKDDMGTVTIGSEIAQSFVDDPKISAVIGHWNSRVTNAVSDIYNRNGMVMITPASTSPVFTTKGYEYIFSTINNDIIYGGTMARYSAECGYDKVVIYYADDDYGRGLANAFEDAAKENGIQVVDRITNLNDSNIQDYINRWNALDYNAIFIADVMTEAMNAITIVRTEGIELPIMGATGIDNSAFVETMGSYAEGVTMPTTFNSTLQREEMNLFILEYQNLYGSFPDSWAIQGYGTVMILCKAMESAGSAMPDKISEALSNMRDYKGVSGELSCNSNGEIIGTDIYVKQIKNGKFIYLGKY